MNGHQLRVESSPPSGRQYRGYDERRAVGEDRQTAGGSFSPKVSRSMIANARGFNSTYDGVRPFPAPAEFRYSIHHQYSPKTDPALVELESSLWARGRSGDSDRHGPNDSRHPAGMHTAHASNSRAWQELSSADRIHAPQWGPAELFPDQTSMYTEHPRINIPQDSSNVEAQLPGDLTTSCYGSEYSTHSAWFYAQMAYYDEKKAEAAREAARIKASIEKLKKQGFQGLGEMKAKDAKENRMCQTKSNTFLELRGPKGTTAQTVIPIGQTGTKTEMGRRSPKVSLVHKYAQDVQGQVNVQNAFTSKKTQDVAGQRCTHNSFENLNDDVEQMKLQIKAQNDAEQLRKQLKAQNDLEQMKAQMEPQNGMAHVDVEMAIDEMKAQILAEQNANKWVNPRNDLQHNAKISIEQEREDFCKDHINVNIAMEQMKTKMTVQQMQAHNAIEQMKAQSTMDQMKAQHALDQIQAQSAMDQMKSQNAIDQMKAQSAVEQIKAEKVIEQVKAQNAIEQIQAQGAKEQMKAQIEQMCAQMKAQIEIERMKAQLAKDQAIVYTAQGQTHTMHEQTNTKLDLDEISPKIAEGQKTNMELWEAPVANEQAKSKDDMEEMKAQFTLEQLAEQKDDLVQTKLETLVDLKKMVTEAFHEVSDTRPSDGGYTVAEGVTSEIGKENHRCATKPLKKGSENQLALENALCTALTKIQDDTTPTSEIISLLASQITTIENEMDMSSVDLQQKALLGVITQLKPLLDSLQSEQYYLQTTVSQIKKSMKNSWRLAFIPCWKRKYKSHPSRKDSCIMAHNKPLNVPSRKTSQALQGLVPAADDKLFGQLYQVAERLEKDIATIEKEAYNPPAVVDCNGIHGPQPNTVNNINLVIDYKQTGATKIGARADDKNGHRLMYPGYSDENQNAAINLISSYVENSVSKKKWWKFWIKKKKNDIGKKVTEIRIPFSQVVCNPDQENDQSIVPAPESIVPAPDSGHSPAKTEPNEATEEKIPCQQETRTEQVENDGKVGDVQMAMPNAAAWKISGNQRKYLVISDSSDVTSESNSGMWKAHHNKPRRRSSKQTRKYMGYMPATSSSDEMSEEPARFIGNGLDYKGIIKPSMLKGESDLSETDDASRIVNAIVKRSLVISHHGDGDVSNEKITEAPEEITVHAKMDVAEEARCSSEEFRTFSDPECTTQDSDNGAVGTLSDPGLLTEKHEEFVVRTSSDPGLISQESAVPVIGTFANPGLLTQELEEPVMRTLSDPNFLTQESEGALGKMDESQMSEILKDEEGDCTSAPISGMEDQPDEISIPVINNHSEARMQRHKLERATSVVYDDFWETGIAVSKRKYSDYEYEESSTSSTEGNFFIEKTSPPPHIVGESELKLIKDIKESELKSINDIKELLSEEMPKQSALSPPAQPKKIVIDSETQLATDRKESFPEVMSKDPTPSVPAQQQKVVTAANAIWLQKERSPLQVSHNKTDEISKHGNSHSKPISGLGTKADMEWLENPTGHEETLPKQACTKPTPAWLVTEVEKAPLVEKTEVEYIHENAFKGRTREVNNTPLANMDWLISDNQDRKQQRKIPKNSLGEQMLPAGIRYPEEETELLKLAQNRRRRSSVQNPDTLGIRYPEEETELLKLAQNRRRRSSVQNPDTLGCNILNILEDTVTYKKIQLFTPDSSAVVDNQAVPQHSNPHSEDNETPTKRLQLENKYKSVEGKATPEQKPPATLEDDDSLLEMLNKGGKYDPSNLCNVTDTAVKERPGRKTLGLTSLSTDETISRGPKIAEAAKPLMNVGMETDCVQANDKFIRKEAATKPKAGALGITDFDATDRTASRGPKIEEATKPQMNVKMENDCVQASDRLVRKETATKPKALLCDSLFKEIQQHIPTAYGSIRGKGITDTDNVQEKEYYVNSRGIIELLLPCDAMGRDLEKLLKAGSLTGGPYKGKDCRNIGEGLLPARKGQNGQLPVQEYMSILGVVEEIRPGQMLPGWQYRKQASRTSLNQQPMVPPVQVVPSGLCKPISRGAIDKSRPFANTNSSGYLSPKQTSTTSLASKGAGLDVPAKIETIVEVEAGGWQLGHGNTAEDEKITYGQGKLQDKYRYGSNSTDGKPVIVKPDDTEARESCMKYMQGYLDLFGSSGSNSTGRRTNSSGGSVKETKKTAAATNQPQVEKEKHVSFVDKMGVASENAGPVTKSGGMKTDTNFNNFRATSNSKIAWDDEPKSKKKESKGIKKRFKNLFSKK